MRNSKFVVLVQFIERFIFYSILSVLALYLLSVYNDDVSKMSDTYSLFHSGLYLSPLIFGILSDIFSKRNFAIGGFLVFAIGLFFFALPNLSEDLVPFPLILIVFAIAAIKPNLIIFIIESVEREKANRIILTLVLFFGITSVSSLLANIYSMIISGLFSYSTVFLTLGFFALIVFGILIIRANPKLIRTKYNPRPKENFDPLVISIIILISLIIAFGNSFTEIIYSSAQCGVPKTITEAMSLTRLLIFLIILIILKYFEIKNLEKFIYYTFILSLVFFTIKFLVVFFLNLEVLSFYIFTALNVIQIIPAMFLYPLFYLIFKKSFWSKYKTFGIAILSVTLVFPHIIQPILTYGTISEIEYYSLLLGLTLFPMIFIVHRFKNRFSHNAQKKLE